MLKQASARFALAAAAEQPCSTRSPERAFASRALESQGDGVQLHIQAIALHGQVVKHILKVPQDSTELVIRRLVPLCGKLQVPPSWRSRPHLARAVFMALAHCLNQEIA